MLPIIRSVLNAHEFTNTFDMPQFSTVSSGTWSCSEPGARNHTLDYICFSLGAPVSVSDVGVHDGIDNGHCVDDHSLLAARFSFLHKQNQPNNPGSAPRVLRSQLRDPHSVAKFNALLQAIPSPAWGVNLEEHYQFLVKSISRAISQAFPKPALTPPKVTF